MDHFKKLRHDFQNNYLRLEVLLSMINDHLQNGTSIDSKYLADLEHFLNLSITQVQEIKQLQES